jgi:hypothetical protein
MSTSIQFKSVKLEFRTPGEDISVKFSDLQETLKSIDWSKVGSMSIIAIPVYRDPDMESAVTRYVFNKQEIYEMEKANAFYEKIIF